MKLPLLITGAVSYWPTGCSWTSSAQIVSHPAMNNITSSTHTYMYIAYLQCTMYMYIQCTRIFQLHVAVPASGIYVLYLHLLVLLDTNQVSQVGPQPSAREVTRKSM